MFVLRVQPNDLGIDPFYMLWALALREVRDQWRRVTLMQTNREDVGKRFCEVCIPMPLSPKWAKEVSCSFRKYFESIAKGSANVLAQPIPANAIALITEALFGRIAIKI